MDEYSNITTNVITLKFIIQTVPPWLSGKVHNKGFPCRGTDSFFSLAIASCRKIYFIQNCLVSQFLPTIMADTYEYPPAFNSYPPLQLLHAATFPTSLKLQHHFFITRAKIVFSEVFKVKSTLQVDRYLQEEIVSPIACKTREISH